MAELAGLRVTVAGAGAVGSTVALALARAGAIVTLADPDPQGGVASRVAAGMLAPVFEALFDELTPEHLILLRRARDLWPALAGSIGLELARPGAMAVAPDPFPEDWATRLERLGVAARRLTAAEAHALSPDLGPGWSGLFTNEDWRLDPQLALAALSRALEGAGARRIDWAVLGFRPGAALLAGGEVPADRLVIATGLSNALSALAPQLARLVPIKGHILQAPGFDLAGPVLRFADGYVCPAPGGAVIGATMEIGRGDEAIDPETVDRLLGVAARAAPRLAGAAVVARTGVRAATPDGLPLVGPAAPAGAPGVWLATGARRNGWLLAPLIADVIVRGLAGEDAAAELGFDPGRTMIATARRP